MRLRQAIKVQSNFWANHKVSTMVKADNRIRRVRKVRFGESATRKYASACNRNAKIAAFPLLTFEEVFGRKDSFPDAGWD